MKTVQRLRQAVSSILTAPRALLTRRAGTHSKACVRGIWTPRCLYPVSISDPEKLLHLANLYGGLPAPSVQRLGRGSLSDKQTNRLTMSMFLAGALDHLRELERLLSGGGVRWALEYDNLVVNEGLDDLLDVTLSGATQDTSWFVGLLAATPTPAATDTATEIAGYDFVAYDEATLQAWVDGGVAAQSVSNTASPAVFTISANGSSIGGAYLIGTNAKATPAGQVYAAGAFTGGNKAADDNDTLEVTATFTTAAA